MKVGIIGGGASAMILASKLENFDVTILERNNKLGKKLLLTGNGKCNYTNLDFNDLKCKYNNDFAIKAYNKYNNLSFIDYFKELGIVPKVEIHKGVHYVYPNSNKSTSVYYCLFDKIVNNKIEILYNKLVSDVRFDGKVFNIICANKEKFKFDKIVLATGGASYPKTGSDGIGYEIAKKLGHRIIDLVPGLTSLEYSFDIKNFSLSGKCRVNATVVYNDNNDIFIESGELQFNEDTISGIPILNFSSKIGRKLAQNKSVEFSIDFSNVLVGETNSSNKLEKVKSFLFERKNNTGYRDIKDFLCGYLPDEINELIFKKAKLNCKNISDMTERDIDILADLITNMKIKAIYSNNFDNAQVTLGGVDVTQVNNETLESKLIKGLYFTGEILDIDGCCGGYNLQMAYSTASLVADALKEKIHG